MIKKAYTSVRLFFRSAFSVLLFSTNYFKRDKCHLFTASLSYYSILSIVPILSLGLALSKGFGLENLLRKELKETFGAYQEVFDLIYGFAQALLKFTGEEALVLASIIFLFISVLGLLYQVELSFNQVWGIKKSRPMIRKLTDYITIVFTVPIFILFSSSFKLFIASNLSIVSEWSEAASSFLNTAIDVIPFLVIWLSITILYWAIPNTSVKIKSALIAGFFVALAYNFTEWVYVYFQIGISRYNAVYGSFAILPLMMIWVRLGWTIVLFGAEMCYSIHYKTINFKDIDLEKMSLMERLSVTVFTLLYIKNYFANNHSPINKIQLQKELPFSIKSIDAILNKSVDAKLLVKVLKDDDMEDYFHPAVPLKDLTPSLILDRIFAEGVPYIEKLKNENLSLIKENLEKVFSSNWSKFNKVKLEP